ncbi:MAG: phosphocholine cytidylyltransferase family protein [Elusimicrobiales bacterium]
MKAVIMAAGRGTRLHPLTRKKPKCLLETGGQTLLGRSLKILRGCGIKDIGIIVGFEKEQIIARHGRGCRIIVNPFYPLCNNMGSLWFARDFAGGGPFAALHADLVYEPEILTGALRGCRAGEAACLAVDFGPVDAEAMKARVSVRGLLLDGGKDIAKPDGEWTGISLVRDSRGFFKAIEDELMSGGHGSYDMAAYLRLARAGGKVRCVPTGGLCWKEIDFADDYRVARELFK